MTSNCARVNKDGKQHFLWLEHVSCIILYSWLQDILKDLNEEAEKVFSFQAGRRDVPD